IAADFNAKTAVVNGTANVDDVLETAVRGRAVHARIELADGGRGSCRRDRAAARGRWKRRWCASSSAHPSRQCGSRFVHRGSAVAGAYDGRPRFNDHGPCMVGQAVETRLTMSCRRHATVHRQASASSDRGKGGDGWHP
ncbi:hypothetical protein ACLOJK_037142, partial [Asimina triloba]